MNELSPFLPPHVKVSGSLCAFVASGFLSLEAKEPSVVYPPRVFERSSYGTLVLSVCVFEEEIDVTLRVM